MDALNKNDRGLELNCEASQSNIHFLYIKISIKGGQFITSTYFKPTNCNSFISMDSCHHQYWLKSVSRGQFMRIRCSYTKQNDCAQQADVLAQLMVGKGYNAGSLGNG